MIKRKEKTLLGSKSKKKHSVLIRHFSMKVFSLLYTTISIIGLLLAVRTRFSFGKSFELIFNIIAWSIDTYTVGTHFVVLGNWKDSKTSNTSKLNQLKTPTFRRTYWLMTYNARRTIQHLYFQPQFHPKSEMNLTPISS